MDTVTLQEIRLLQQKFGNTINNKEQGASTPTTLENFHHSGNTVFKSRWSRLDDAASVVISAAGGACNEDSGIEATMVPRICG